MKKKTANPPRLAEGLLRFCNRRDDSYSLIGDIQEEFTEIADSKGIRAARRWYWKQTLRSIPTLLKDSFLWGGYLFKSYIKLAWRNIRKYKTFSFINVAGLATGLEKHPQTQDIFIYKRGRIGCWPGLQCPDHHVCGQ